MSLLGMKPIAADLTTRHRTVVERGREGLWWWQCRQCPDHFGYGNSWARVFAAAERHALGRRLR